MRKTHIDLLRGYRVTLVHAAEEVSTVLWCGKCYKTAGDEYRPLAPPMTLNGLEELRKLQEDYQLQKHINRIALGVLEKTLNNAQVRDRPPNEVEYNYHMRELNLAKGVLQGDRGMIYQASEELYPK